MPPPLYPDSAWKPVFWVLVSTTCMGQYNLCVNLCVKILPKIYQNQENQLKSAKQKSCCFNN